MARRVVERHGAASLGGQGRLRHVKPRRVVARFVWAVWVRQGGACYGTAGLGLAVRVWPGELRSHQLSYGGLAREGLSSPSRYYIHAEGREEVGWWEGCGVGEEVTLTVAGLQSAVAAGIKAANAQIRFELKEIKMADPTYVTSEEKDLRHQALTFAVQLALASRDHNSIVQNADWFLEFLRGDASKDE